MSPTLSPHLTNSPAAAARSHRIVLAALSSWADDARRTAASRKLAGPENAAARASWRAYSADCREIAAALDAAGPYRLAALLLDGTL